MNQELKEQKSDTHERLINHKFSKLKQIIKNNWIIIGILFIAFILRIFHLSQNLNLWWDSSVYLGVAKYIYTLGSNGIFEPYRPLIHPIILGFFWKIGANVVLIGKSLDLIFSITTVYLTYLITKQVYSQKAANYAAFIFAIEPLFMMFTGLILTEPLALTITLLAIYLFINRKEENSKISIIPRLKIHNKQMIIGALFALAALTKFPLAIIFFSALITRQLITRKKLLTKNQSINFIKESIFLIIGFSIPFIIYLINNYVLYKDPLFPFTSGSWIVGTLLWQYDTSFLFYFTDFLPIFQIFALLPIAIIMFFLTKDYKHESRTFILISSILLFSYFWLMVPRKEIRYLILIYPFWIILISDIITKIETKISTTLFSNNKCFLNKINKYIAPIILITAIIGAQTFPAMHISYKTTIYDQEMAHLGEYINENKITEPILTSSPYIIEHIDNLIYPTGDISLADLVYEQKKSEINYFLIRDCDYICQKDDQDCINSKNNFLTKVDYENFLVYSKDYTFKRNKCHLNFYQVSKAN